MYVPKSRTAVVMRDVPVRLYNGRFVMRQCKPRLRTIIPQTANKIADSQKTVGDILAKLKFNNDRRSLIIKTS